MDPNQNQNAHFLNFMKMSKSIQTSPIYVTSTENRLKSVEELTDFFMQVYEKEMEINKVNETTIFSNPKLACMGGSKPIERCCYLYSQATCHTLLVKDCVTRFLNAYSDAENLIDSWRSSLNITSLSLGPGVDCIAFSLAILEVSKVVSTVVSEVSIIPTSCVKWIRTVKILTTVLQEVKTPLNINYSKTKVSLNAVFKPSKAHFLRFIQNSNVVLMFKTLNLNQLKEQNFLKMLRNGAMIFSINHLSESAEMQAILEEEQGTFLYGPVTLISHEVMVEIPGKSPTSVPSTTYEFFVWIKNPFVSAKSVKPLDESNEKSFIVPYDLIPKKLTISRKNLKRVKMLYSFHDDDIKNSKATQTNFVSLAVLENNLNSTRLVTDFFMEVFKKEAAQFKVRESIDLVLSFPVLSSRHVDFDDPNLRCGYMYFYATCHTLLMKECIVRFLTDYPNLQNLLLKWKSNPNHCSLSHGPGLDYIAFSLAVLQVTKQPTPITDVKIVTPCKWKSTADMLSQVIQRVKTPLNLNYDKKFTQYQVLGIKWKAKAVKFLKEASVVFMFKTLNLGEKEIREYPPPLLVDVVGFISPGTLIFFMDSVSSLSAMKTVLGCYSGTFLHGPTTVHSRELGIEVSEKLQKSMQLLPAQEEAVEFFVWEKTSKDLTPFKELQEPYQQSEYLQASFKPTEIIRTDSADLKPSQDPTVSFHSKSAERSVVEVPSQSKVVDFLLSLFMRVYEKEVSQCRDDQSIPLSTVLKSLSTLHASYNATCMRCAYVYRYAACNTLLIKDCISRFLTEYSRAGELLKQWRLNSKFCSLSLGPCLDYIAFSLAVLEHTKQPMIIAKANILTKYIGWKNTVDILLADKALHFLKFVSTAVSKGSVFESWGSQAIDSLLGANVLFMFKALDLDEGGRKTHPSFIRELINFLTVGSVIFFIDTPYSSKIMQEALLKHQGTLLYGPVSVTCTDMTVEIPAELQKVIELLSGQGETAEFFVWQKNLNTQVLSKSLHNLEPDCDSLPFKYNSLENLYSSSKLAPSMKNESSLESQDDNSSSSSESPTAPPALSWRAKQELNKKSIAGVKVGNKNKIIEHLSFQDSDPFKKNVSLDHESSSSSDSSFNEKELNSTSKIKPVVSRSLMKLKELIETSNNAESASVVNSFEPDSSKLPNNVESTSKNLPQISAATEMPRLKETLSGDQVGKFSSLITKIELFSNDVENSFDHSFEVSKLSNSENTLANRAAPNFGDTNELLQVPEPSTDEIEESPGNQVENIQSLITRIKSFSTLEAACFLEKTLEPDGHKQSLLSTYGKSNSENHFAPLSHADTQIVPSMQMEEALSDKQMNRIRSLIGRIERISSFIENNFNAPSQVSTEKGCVSVKEINLLTEKINKVTLELSKGNQNRSPENGSLGGEILCFSCITSKDTSKPPLNLNSSSKSVPENEEAYLKSDAGDDYQNNLSCNCEIVSQCHCSEACVHQPSTPRLVIPLESISTELLSLLLSSNN